MTAHQYTLEPYKGMTSRYHCPGPNCGTGKTLSRYINNDTGEHIHPTVGRCSRESKCGYHYTPKQYFQDNPTTFDEPRARDYHWAKAASPPPKPKPVSVIPLETLKASLTKYEANNFVTFLIGLFGETVTSGLIARYFLGTSRHVFKSREVPDYTSDQGATVFWQIDILGKVRTGKIMHYNPATGKRTKKPFNHITWAHSALKLPEFELSQCLFGEHLLTDKSKPVAIVESEKTAIIASVYFPKFIWLAFGGIGFRVDKCSILKGRTVLLFPDLNGFEKWSIKAKELSHVAKFAVSDYLERNAPESEKKAGLDLADYLIRFDIKDFALPEPPPAPTPSLQVAIGDIIQRLVVVNDAPQLQTLTKFRYLYTIFNHFICPQVPVDTLINELGHYLESRERANAILKEAEQARIIFPLALAGKKVAYSLAPTNLAPVELAAF